MWAEVTKNTAVEYKEYNVFCRYKEYAVDYKEYNVFCR